LRREKAWGYRKREGGRYGDIEKGRAEGMEIIELRLRSWEMDKK